MKYDTDGWGDEININMEGEDPIRFSMIWHENPTCCGIDDVGCFEPYYQNFNRTPDLWKCLLHYMAKAGVPMMLFTDIYVAPSARNFNRITPLSFLSWVYTEFYNYPRLISISGTENYARTDSGTRLIALLMQINNKNRLRDILEDKYNISDDLDMSTRTNVFEPEPLFPL